MLLRALPWLLLLVLMPAAHAAGSRVIEGVVVASTGPVGGVEVRATHEDRAVTTHTDAQGHFLFRGLSDDGWTLTAARGAEHGEMRVSVVIANERGVVLEIGPPRVVRGIVRSATGAPLQGIRVEAGLQDESGPVNAREVRTEGDGQFEIPVPGFSPIAVQVRAPGHLPRYVAGAPYTQKLDLVLVRTEELRGVVTDSQGTPVPGVRLRLKRYGRTMYPTSCTGPDPMTAVTGANGAFTVSGLEPGRYTFLLKPREHAAINGDVEVPTPHVRWTLTAGVRATVAVTGPDGAPLPASVTFGGPTSSPDVFASERTLQADASGTAVFDGLVPGTYWLRADLQSEREQRTVHRQVQVTGEGPAMALGFPGMHRLRGSLVNERGQPVRGAVLSLSQTESQRAGLELRREGLNGSFSLDHLPEGALKVSVWAEGHEPLDTTVQLPAKAPLRLVLKRTPRIRVSGRVADAKGRPVPSFQLGSTAVEHAEGRFSVPLESYGQPIHLTLSAEGLASRLVTLDPRRPVSLKLGEVRLGTGRTLTGRVETPEGRGLARAWVRCRWARLPKSSYEQPCHGRTLPDGSLYLARVPEEPIVLEITHPDWPRTRLLVPEGITSAYVRLSAGLTVQGTVKDWRGQPLEGGSVETELDGEPHFAKIGADGTYTLRVPPGRGTVEVLNRPSEPGTFEGTDGQTARVDLRVLSGH